MNMRQKLREALKEIEPNATIEKSQETWTIFFETEWDAEEYFPEKLLDTPAGKLYSEKTGNPEYPTRLAILVAIFNITL